MSVYFAYSARGNLVKIGFTAVSADNRVRAFNSLTGLKSRLIAVLPGPRSEEQAMHKRFISVKIGYECFRLEGNLLDFLVTVPGALKALRQAGARSSATVFLNDQAVYVAYGRYRGERLPPQRPRRRRALFDRLSRELVQAERVCAMESEFLHFRKYRGELSEHHMGI